MNDIHDYQHIVIAFEEFNSLGIIRGLGEDSIFPDIILLKEVTNIIIKCCRYCGTISYINDEQDIVPTLFKIKRNNGLKAFIHTGCDPFVNVLDINYDVLKEDFYFYNAGNAGRVTEFMHKDVITELAEKCGLKVPKSELLKKGELPQTLSFPVFSKTSSPLMDGWKQDVYIFHSMEEISKAYDSFTSAESLFQEYVDKEYDYTLHGISINAGREVNIGLFKKYLRSSDISYGAYMEYIAFDNSSLLDSFQKMFFEIGYTGVFGIDMLRGKDGLDYFLEINFRHDGINYGCTFANFNYCTIWANSILAGKLEIPSNIRKNPFTVIKGFVDIKGIWNIGIHKWFVQFLKADVHLLFNKNDMKPFWGFIFSKVYRYVHKAIH